MILGEFVGFFFNHPIPPLKGIIWRAPADNFRFEFSVV